MPNRYGILKEYGTFTIGNAVQTPAEEKAKVYGDIVGMFLDINVSLTIGSGTRGSGAYALNLINRLTIKDANGSTLYDFANVGYGQNDLETLGNALALRLRGNNARAISCSALTDTGGSFSGIIPLYINMADQPITVSITVGTLGDILSTVGTASCTMTLAIGFVYDEPAVLPDGRPAKSSVRTQTNVMTGISAGDMKLEKAIPDGSLITLISWLNTESYVNKVKFTSDGVAEWEFASANALKSVEAILFPDYTHRTKQFTLPVLPFYKNNRTDWLVNYSTGENPRIHVIIN